MVSHSGVAVGRPLVLVTRLGSESISMTLTIFRLAYLESAMIDAIGSMNSLLYLLISVGPSSPLEARAAQSRPGRS